MQSLFNSGVMSLRERAIAERFILAIMVKVAEIAEKDDEARVIFPVFDY